MLRWGRGERLRIENGRFARFCKFLFFFGMTRLVFTVCEDEVFL